MVGRGRAIAAETVVIRPQLELDRVTGSDWRGAEVTGGALGAAERTVPLLEPFALGLEPVEELPPSTGTYVRRITMTGAGSVVGTAVVAGTVVGTAAEASWPEPAVAPSVATRPKADAAARPAASRREAAAGWRRRRFVVARRPSAAAGRCRTTGAATGTGSVGGSPRKVGGSLGKGWSVVIVGTFLVVTIVVI